MKKENQSDLAFAAERFMFESVKARYSYNFKWLSRPIIQYPQDIVATQEIIWDVKPDLIIETGIAHGGSLMLSASMLALVDYCEALDAGLVIDPTIPKRKVIGVDIDIRDENRAKLDSHPLRNRLELIEGSSIDEGVVEQVRSIANKFDRVMVFLDSNHTHDHVLAELEAYAPLVSEGSYCVVFDSVIEDLPSSVTDDRQWGPGNSPKSAVREYLNSTDDFEVDSSIDQRLLISVAPGGYLRKK